MSCAEGELRALRRGIEGCRKCRLGAQRRHAVPGEGPAGAAILVVGEAPGAAEDASGAPFRGAAGAFLDDMLAEAGMDRTGVFVTNCVKCRPPANRSPRADELATCRTAWLVPQIEAVDPRLVLTLGRTALGAVLGARRPLREVHGRPVRQGARIVLPTYHPAAGMRFPAIGARMRQDFAGLRRAAGLP